MSCQWLVTASIAVASLSFVPSPALAETAGDTRAVQPIATHADFDLADSSEQLRLPATAPAIPTNDNIRTAALKAQATRSAAMKWETTYLLLSAVDAAQTIECLEAGVCKELNPLFGKNPSPGKIIGAKLVLGTAHYLLFRKLANRSPKTALRVAQISTVVQGGVVLLNARITFR